MASTSAYDADASSSSLGTTSQSKRNAPKHDLTSLNSELVSHGWTKRPLSLDGLSEQDMSEVISIIYEVVGSAISNVENLDALAARYRTLEYEQDRTAKALNLSRTAQRKAECDAAGWRTRVADLERRLAMEEAKTKELREDVGRARKAVDSVRIAASQEQKKAQARYDAAQAKIARYASDSSMLSQAQGMVLLNPIAPGRGAPMAIGQAALLEHSLRDLTGIRESVQQENEDFRHVVVSAGNALREALAMSQGDKEASRLHQSQFFTVTPSLRASTHAAGISTSPTFPEIADVRLKSLISSLSSVLSSRIIRVPVSDPAAAPVDPEETDAIAKAAREEAKRMQDLLDRMKDLEVEVECAKGRELEAKRTMEEMTNRQRAESMAKVGEREKDAGDLLEILKEREGLEQERRKVRELVSGYERERKTFESERKAFQEERRRVDVDSILAQLPGTPSSSSSTIRAVPEQRPLAALTEATDVGSSSSRPDSASSSYSAFADASDSASSSASPARPKAISQIQAQAQWNAHRPASPSPLSPHKARTPKAHMAAMKGKRMRTPLSRLVLEKAARKGSADGAVSGSTAVAGASSTSSGVKALGEGGRKLNTSSSTAPLSASVKGKGKMTSSTSVMGNSTSGQAKATDRRRVSPAVGAGATGRVLSSSGLPTGGAKGSLRGSAAVGASAPVSGATQGAAAGRSKPVWR